MTKDVNMGTKETITWCPGCPNFMILESVKRALKNLVVSGFMRHEDIAISTGIGCHPKIFDYLNVSGVYGLHGRPIATAVGMKLGNPNLKTIAFAGDGDTYAEGIAHFIHAARYNSDMNLIVSDNQSFSLTTGQPTPTSQQGFKSKAMPQGEPEKPLNPIKLALAAGCSFVARCNARDMNHTQEVIEKAIKHKGFSYIEIIQDCLIFNKDINGKDSMMYKVEDNKDINSAYKLADEWNYNGKVGKIALGVLYSEDKPTLEDKWPQLKLLKDKKVGWKGLKR